MNLNVMSWNIKAGGYASYEDVTTPPERETAITDVINDARLTHDIDSLGLVDAHRWSDTYGSDEGIARHLGFKAARFVALDDERLNRNAGKHIGIVLATDKPVHRWKTLDLETRQASSVILDVGAYGVQLVIVYLDDISEATRVRQIRALRNNMEQGIPTIVTGDCNMLRPDLRLARHSDHFFDMVLKMGLPVADRLLGKSPTIKTLVELNKREAYDAMTDDRAFMDADFERCRPTETRLGHLSVDYSFVHDLDLAASDFVVLDSGKASDHKPIITKLSGEPTSASL